MNAYIRAIQCCLPDRVVTNEDLQQENPDWDPQVLFDRTGIRARHITTEEETAGDLAFRAAEQLLNELHVERSSIDVLLLCTQSPDLRGPSTACLLQTRLGLSSCCGAFDYNLGCSGYTYGLWLARALLLSGSARCVLLLASETYSKSCAPHDVMTRPLFGDAGSATLIDLEPRGALALIGRSVVGTNGAGASALTVSGGGARHRHAIDQSITMNGLQVANFTLREVRPAIERAMRDSELTPDSIDWFLFHQANAYLIQRLSQSMKLPAEKVPIFMEDIGNTGSASLPVLIERCRQRGLLQAGQRCLLAGFGVGFSWGMTMLEWLATATEDSGPKS